MCPLSVSQSKETLPRTCPIMETPQLVARAYEGPVPGSAEGTRGLPSLIKVPWGLWKYLGNIARSWSSSRYRWGLKGAKIPLSGFLICSLAGKVLYPFTLQIPAQLSSALEGVDPPGRANRCLCARAGFPLGPLAGCLCRWRHLPHCRCPLDSLWLTEPWAI